MARQLLIDQPFDLELSLTMGQAFRWKERPDGWFSGVLGENLVHIRQTDNGAEYRVGGPDGERDPTSTDDELLRRYFREDDDVAAIYDDIARDAKIATIMQEFPGLRLLRQEPWECLVAYICSANNNITQISRTVEKVADVFGIAAELDGETRCIFPSAKRMMADDDALEKLHELRLGLQRAPNIIAAAGRVCAGEPDLGSLITIPYPKAKAGLTQIRGVGDKIADCVALFALDKLTAFPVDKWIWRAITEAYPEWGFPENAEPTDRERREVAERARQVFGKYAGYANQYLFYWRRQHGEGPLPFGTRWRGKFRITPPEGHRLDDQYLDELRHEYLKGKYLSC